MPKGKTTAFHVPCINRDPLTFEGLPTAIKALNTLEASSSHYSAFKNPLGSAKPCGSGIQKSESDFICFPIFRIIQKNLHGQKYLGLQTNTF